MASRLDELDRLRHEVNINLAFGAVSDLELVTNDVGDCPVVVALDSEPLSIVLGRLRAVGGYGTVFSRGEHGVRVLSMLREACAISEPEDPLALGPGAEFGMFIDYVAHRPGGVAISAAFDQPAKAKDARLVDLAAS